MVITALSGGLSPAPAIPAPARKPVAPSTAPASRDAAATVTLSGRAAAAEVVVVSPRAGEALAAARQSLKPEWRAVFDRLLTQPEETVDTVRRAVIAAGQDHAEKARRTLSPGTGAGSSSRLTEKELEQLKARVAALVAAPPSPSRDAQLKALLAQLKQLAAELGPEVQAASGTGSVAPFDGAAAATAALNGGDANSAGAGSAAGALAGAASAPLSSGAAATATGARAPDDGKTVTLDDTKIGIIEGLGSIVDGMQFEEKNLRASVNQWIGASVEASNLTRSMLDELRQLAEQVQAGLRPQPGAGTRERESPGQTLPSLFAPKAPPSRVDRIV